METSDGLPAGSPKGSRGHKGPAEDRASGYSGFASSPASAVTDALGSQGQVYSPAVVQAEPAPGMNARPADNAQGSAAPSSVSDPSSSTPPQPAAQLGHALAGIHTAANGSSQVRILLNPAELGSVHVQITRTHDGASSVSLSVERPETLRSLQGDLNHLHQALDRAGVPERSVVLHLAPPDNASGAPANGQGGSGGQGTAQGGSQQNANQGRSHDLPNGKRNENAVDARLPQAAWTAVGLHRAGVNITA